MSNINPDFAIGHVRLDDAGVGKKVEANGFKLVPDKRFPPGSQYMAVLEKKGCVTLLSGPLKISRRGG